MIDPTILQFMVGMVAGTLGGLVIVRKRSMSSHKTRSRSVSSSSLAKARSSSSSSSKSRLNNSSTKTSIKAKSTALNVRPKGHTKISRPKGPVVVVAPVHHRPQATTPTTTPPTSPPVAIDITTTRTKSSTTLPGESKYSPSTFSAPPVASPSIPPSFFSTCPACGLEAPEALLAEHFIQSPSHRTPRPAPPIIVAVPTSQSSNLSEEKVGDEDDPNLSFRNLLQILVPPRAFGHRAQQRTVNPLSKMVQAIPVPTVRSD